MRHPALPFLVLSANARRPVWKDRLSPRLAALDMIDNLSQSVTENPMTDVDALFEQARHDVTQLPEKPGNLTLLRLYALFKQASAGDVHGERPGLTDIVGKYKYDAWAALKGTARDTAKQQYAELVESLKNGTAT
jgi:acyl-CoA-binding protein